MILEEMSAVIRNATPAPWRVNRSDTPGDIALDAKRGDPRLDYGVWNEAITCHGSDEQADQGEAVARANAEFISMARQYMPVIIDELTRARESLASREHDASCAECKLKEARHAVAVTQRDLAIVELNIVRAKLAEKTYRG